jgi:NAD(P)-dependent dehydrogenase (short-subunit alcohol dehydrogenase family)
MDNPFQLKNKVVFVNGASSGIGREVAIQCANLGATVVITGRNPERLNETFSSLKGDGHQQVVADLNDSTQLIEVVKSLPQLDGVVLCAGVSDTFLLKFATRKKVDGIFETNFFAQVELLRLLQKNKLLKNGSSVVAISSIGGNFVTSIGLGVYGASKAALLSWMKTAALELAPLKIRVNCICPGAIETPMSAAGTLSEEQLKQYTETIALKRMGKPEEIAYGVVYLLSDAAQWVTGTSLIIDGGTSL